MILVLIGKSGSGKSTVAKTLEEMFGYERILTCTTRSPRKGEFDGVDYRFLSSESFNEKISKKEFMEYRKYNASFGEVFYGSLKEDFKKSKKPRIIILNPDGVVEVLDKIKKSSDFDDMFFVDIDVDEEVLKARLEKRGDSLKEIERRLKSDESDLQKIKKSLKNGIIKPVNGNLGLYSVCFQIQDKVESF